MPYAALLPAGLDQAKTVVQTAECSHTGTATVALLTLSLIDFHLPGRMGSRWFVSKIYTQQSCLCCIKLQTVGSCLTPCSLP